jgi:hypothetical protein
MAIRSGKISAIAACAATAAVVHIFALRPFAFMVINVASSSSRSSRRRASLAQDSPKTDVYHCAAREEAPPDKASVDVGKWGGWPRQRTTS